MPKSSAEYIIRKAAESSLLGLPQVLGRSPLAEEIEARGEAAYRPSKAEKGAAWALGATADTVMLGGAGSWATFAKFIGADAAVSAVAGHLDKDKPEGPTVETCISKGVFGIDGNVFTTFRKEAAAISPQETSPLPLQTMCCARKYLYANLTSRNGCKWKHTVVARFRGNRT